MAYVKLDCELLYSSLWRESNDVKVVFITMLAMADATGFVAAKAPGIAAAASIDREDARAALARLEEPDPDSRSPEHEGRRIIAIDGGYHVVNYRKYRTKDHTGAERQRRYRERQRALDTASEAEPEPSPRLELVKAPASEPTTTPEPIDDTPPKPAPKREAVPVGAVVDLYHEVLPELPRVLKVTDARRAQIAARWHQGDLASLDDWRWFFLLVRESDFLMGRCKARRDGGPPWRADLEWLTKQSNAVKVAEGRYDSDTA